jgi:S1-C subfamily serine protease
VKNIVALIVALLSGCVGCSVFQMPLRPLTTEEISERFELALNGTVAIIRDDGVAFCSGAWLDNNRVLTARHCVDEGNQYRVGAYWDYDYLTNTWRNTYAFELDRVSKVDDVAILRQMEPAETIPHTNLPVLRRHPLVGERVFAIGAPMGFGYYHSEGRVIAPMRVGAIRPFDRWTQHSAPTHPGMSGGPVLTEDGEILCITSFILWRKPTLSGCVHVDAIHELVE